MKLKLTGYKKQIRKMTDRLIAVDKDVVEKSYKIIDVVTDKLMDESIKRSPVDEGFLEKSHEKKVFKSLILKNIHGYVFIPVNSPASDYAMFMHELSYRLGLRSQNKQTDNPLIKVGRKYLERALTENERAYALYILKELEEFLGD